MHSPVVSFYVGAALTVRRKAGKRGHAGCSRFSIKAWESANRKAQAAVGCSQSAFSTVSTVSTLDAPAFFKHTKGYYAPNI